MNTTKRARLSMILSMACFGTLAPFVRNISVSSGELALYRAILASFLIGLFLLLTKQRLSFRSLKKELVLLLFSGIHSHEIDLLVWIVLQILYAVSGISREDKQLVG